MAKPSSLVVSDARVAGLNGEEARRRAILDSAAELFFEQGFDAVSVDAIIARAGGSKTNVYRLFGNKDKLFEVLITEECERLSMPLRGARLIAETATSLAGALDLIGHAYLDVITDARSVSIHRLVIAQFNRFPNLAQIFFAAGPEGSTRLISDAFEVLKARNLLDPVGDIASAARQFMNLLRADIQLKLLVGVGSAPLSKMRARFVAETCEVFICVTCRGVSATLPKATGAANAIQVGKRVADRSVRSVDAETATAETGEDEQSVKSRVRLDQYGPGSGIQALYGEKRGKAATDVPFAASVGYQVRVTHRALQRYLQSKIEPHGVTLGMWYFLRVLWQSDGLSQRELSARIGTMEPTTLKAIAAMETRGLVRRERDPSDRRRQSVFLAPRGRALRSKLIPLAAQVIRDAAAGLSPREVAHLLALLGAIQDNLAMNLPEGQVARGDDI